MKSLIVYCSEYKGNTEKIARIFAEKTNSELINIRAAGDMCLENYDVIGFGSGVYRESLSPKLFKLVDRLNLKGKKVFVFSTSGVGMKFYNNSLIKLLEAKGAASMGSFACMGSFAAGDFTRIKIFGLLELAAQGHPNERDFIKAEGFIENIMEHL